MVRVWEASGKIQNAGVLGPIFCHLPPLTPPPTPLQGQGQRVRAQMPSPSYPQLG